MFTLRVLLFLLLFPLASMDDHPSVEALQEARRLLPLLNLDLQPKDQEVALTLTRTSPAPGTRESRGMC